MSSLFRPEAIDGQRQSWLGEVRLDRPVPLTVLTVWAVGMAALLVGYAFTGEYTRKTRLEGVLELQEGGARPGALQAALCAPPSVVGLLRTGQPAVLRYEVLGDGPVAHRPGGRIVEVARTPMPVALCAASAGGSGAGAAESRYRVVVALAAGDVGAGAQASDLGPGMRVDAVILLERRRIVDWLFEPAAQAAGG